MRDPKRIDRITALLNEIWKLKPDLRLFQLIYIMQNTYSDQNGGLGRVVERKGGEIDRVGYDLFGLEDEVALHILKNCLAEFQRVTDKYGD